MKMLSMQRPRPSMEMRTPAALSMEIQPVPVKWLPWSVFMISGGSWVAKASSSASRQKLAPRLFESRQASTLRWSEVVTICHGATYTRKLLI